MRAFVATIFILLFAAHGAAAQPVTLWDGEVVASIVHDGTRTGALAAGLLARDLKALTGRDARVSSTLTGCGPVCIVASTYDAPLIVELAGKAGIKPQTLKGQWERYERIAVSTGGTTYLLIAGSDRRGMIYGVVDLTREMGISAWEWWADVTPRKVGRLTVEGNDLQSVTPSVQYRGFFLNDEDWGLQPWAAKTYEPATGDIGPGTYSRIFELMWRLKANTIWPAMHNSTKPFYSFADNPKVADDYAIVVGTSHAEPMMRNNVREWNESTRGPFNYLTNRDALIKYWQERVVEAKPYESIYSLGLRGIHDGPMQGAETDEARKVVTEDVIAVQRDLLSKSLGRSVREIPQVLTIYKEVEDTYNVGLKVPDDVTLVWSDDNYGYLTRLSSPEEQKRPGGAGIYYHISYWGRPHDYLWLSTTHPGLIREQMSRAWAENARREWIFNVGDIKPSEYLATYLMDLAFDHDTFAVAPRKHLQAFMARQFSTEQAGEIADIMMRYYDLAFERRPEFMGWGQTEPTTPTRTTAYVLSDGEEAQHRLAAYGDLVTRAEKVAAALPADRQDAFFQLVLYPVRGAANLNTRILKLDLSQLYAQRGRASANMYSAQAKAAQERIVQDTAQYNSMVNGKWRSMMNMAPRRLPVFNAPAYPAWSPSEQVGCGYAFNGQLAEGEFGALKFRTGKPGRQVVSLYGFEPKDLAWTAASTNASLKLSSHSGVLTASNGYEVRLTVTYDGGNSTGNLTMACGGRSMNVRTQLLPQSTVPAEVYRAIAIPVTSAQMSPQWEILEDVGSQGQVVRARLEVASLDPRDAAKAAPLIYKFTSTSAVGGQATVVALPTKPLHPGLGVRIAVSLDGGPLELFDYATIGRSDEWRENVLSNTAVRSLSFKLLKPGTHELKIYALDPGVVLDRIEIDLDGAPKHYGASFNDF
ncbi:MAG: glycosyl hydrolase 115 family protein [Vicinamibacterales bacterium]